MEPISIIGLAGSVLGIVDIIGRTVSSLRTIQTKYETADLAASLVIAQLSTVKAALGQVMELANSEHFLKFHHQQLLDDLATVLEGCKTISLALEEKVNQFNKMARRS